MSCRTSLAFLVLAATACSGTATTPQPTPPPPPPPPGTLQVLFLGNSLTYTWDIPGMVATMAAAAGELRPVATSVTGPTATLESHWVSGVGLGPLRSGRYDVVVMQQFPPDNPNAADDLFDWSGRWADEARQQQVRPFIYAVWPPEGGALDIAITNSTAAANAKSMGLFPVAQAFRIAAAATPSPRLYGNDGYNPGPDGAWLAALVLTSMLYERSVADFPNVLADRITPADEAVLRAAASQAIAQFGLPGLP